MASPLDPFDPDALSAVATEFDRPVSDLRELLERHQRRVRAHVEVGGVDGLVYEWRQSFRTDPLVERRGDAYYLAVPVRVWADFADRLGYADGERRAVEAVHERQFAADRGQPPDEGVAMLLVRD